MSISNDKLRPNILLLLLVAAKLAVIPAGIPKTPAPIIVLIKLMTCDVASTVPSGEGFGCTRLLRVAVEVAIPVLLLPPPPRSRCNRCSDDNGDGSFTTYGTGKVRVVVVVRVLIVAAVGNNNDLFS